MIEAWFDGACWPNPSGHAACGALVKRDGVQVWSACEYLGSGQTSNNVAEYSGLILILKYFIANDIQDATVYGDADLVIKQMSGEWKIRAKSKKPRFYLPFVNEAKLLALKLPRLTYKWISRDYNTEADRLSTQPLRDRGLREDYHVASFHSELDNLFESALARNA